MAPNSRVAKAFKAMKNIGVPEETVKPVLTKLLDLYDQKWKLIEDENYRVLIDAIFDHEFPKREGGENKESLLQEEREECEQPLKRSRLRSQTDQSSASSAYSSSFSDRTTHLLVEDKELGPRTISPSDQCTGKGKKPAFPQSCTKSGSVSPTKYPQDGGDIHMSLQIVPRETILDYERGDSHNELKVGPSADLAPKDNLLYRYHDDEIVLKNEPFEDDLLCFDAPLAVIRPACPSLLGEDGPSNGTCSTVKEHDLEFLDSERMDVEDRNAICIHSEMNARDLLVSEDLDKEDKGVDDTSQFDIASSPKGEVKISLICNSIQQSGFHTPNLGAVLKRVEEMYFNSYRIKVPGFSVIKLMKDMCQCFLEEGTNSSDVEKEKSVDVSPSLNVSKKSSAQDVLSCRDNHTCKIYIPPSFSDETLKSENPTEVVPQIPRFRALEGPGSSSSRRMVVVEKPHSPLDPHKLYVHDITRGEEKVKISLVNEITNDSLPKFFYIPRNAPYHNAYVKFLLARISDDNCCSNCFGDCLSLSIPCACAGETGGEFAYSPGGLVEEKFLEKCILMNRDPQQLNLFYCKDCPLERSKDRSLSGPCKGHVVRKFIKECWYKCGCSSKCGNRVVQRGITVNLQVFMTPGGKGWGLRTLEDLPKGAFVCEYVGEIVTNMELYERNLQSRGENEKHTYPVLLDADWGSEGVLKDEEALCLDATLYGNVARFINHRCFDCNLVEIPVEVETPDHHYYHLAFFTRRKVDAFEELTWDYGIDFNDHSHPIKAFQCRCESKFCRDVKHQKSWN